MKASQIVCLAGSALALAAIALAATIIGLAIVGSREAPLKNLLQSGTFALDLYVSPTVLDTQNSTYRLYQGNTGYLLELDAPATELTVPNGDATASAFVQVRMHTFVPIVIPLATFSYAGTIFPLSQTNLALIVPDGSCYDPPTPTCNIAAVQGHGNLTANAIAAATESTSHGYLTFYMQRIATVNNTQNWGNYTLAISGTLGLTLWSA